VAVATAVHCHAAHAMILDCILVDYNGEAWFRFKNTDPKEKAIEIKANGEFESFIKNIYKLYNIMKYLDDNCAPAEFYYIYLDFRPGTEKEIKSFDEADKNKKGFISSDQYR